jgi:cystathionine beta-lyase
MKYNFDKQINRRGTNSIKWEYIPTEKGVFTLERTDQFFGINRKLPMWIADMDFRSPEPVIDALTKRAQHGLYGYTYKGDSYFEAVIGWMKKRHGWAIKREWISTSPGVVAALAMLVRTFVRPGEKVIVQPPVYRPFYLAAEFNGAEIVKNPLIYEVSRVGNPTYSIDFEDLQRKARDPKVRMLILCSPHNPVGRVWTRQELTRLGEICLANNVLVVSDEIHGDLVYKGHPFTPIAKISRAIAQNSVTCTAPSKTFNLAGLSTSNIIIPDRHKHEQFEKTLLSNALIGVDIFGSIALEAAYNHGADWLDQLLVYLEGNIEYLENYVAEHIPQLRLVRPEGTYLAWLDCRGLGLDSKQLKRLMQDKARVYIEGGTDFGPEGEGFVRMNIGCPRAVLKLALNRIRSVVKAQ